MATILILIDLFARLKHFGVYLHHIFLSYLSGRIQRVNFDKNFSHQLQPYSEVPQGSILDPLLFTLYTSFFKGLITTENIVIRKITL